VSPRITSVNSEKHSFSIVFGGLLFGFRFGDLTESLVTLFNERLSETLLGGEGNEGLSGSLSDDDTVLLSGAERVVVGILNVSNVVRTVVDLDVLEDTDATNIVSSSNEDTGSILELEASIDISGLEVKLDGVVNVDLGVGVSDGSTVMGDDVWDRVFADAFLVDLAEFELGFLLGDLDGGEASLDIVEDSEVFSGLGDGDDVHESKGESVVSTDLVVYSDVSVILILADLEALHSGESVLQSGSEEDREGDALSHLVGTGGGSGGVNTSELGQEPVLGGEHALHMLFGTSSLLFEENKVSMNAIKEAL
jgi:hypothetical protein